MARNLGRLIAMSTLIVMLAPVTLCFTWNSKKTDGSRPSLFSNSMPSKSPVADRRLPHVYEVAMNELQELEREPLCHRVAARLLVNNCQLLDGKDEASILTDSGRQIRDFVDSYAASLAICDLERGSFHIPAACSDFREPVLVHLPPSSEAVLHVTSKQIDSCLIGLATSDSAWNTWVSYRHKALRFCEAARADNEKAQNVLLYQRLTKVISDLVEGTEVELRKRMEDVERHTRSTMNALENLGSRINVLKGDLAGLHEYLTGDLDDVVKTSKETLQRGLTDAERLQTILDTMIKVVLDSGSQVAVAHKQSIEQLHLTTDNEIDSLLSTVALAVASSATLHNQIEQSRLQAENLDKQQTTLESGIQRLVNASNYLYAKYEDHTRFLGLASNMTDDLLDTLQDTASSASKMQETFSREYSRSSWWPYIVCPAATLVMGSYGLPPSVVRNLGLVALGEAIGLLIDAVDGRDITFSINTFNATVNSTFEGL